MNSTNKILETIKHNICAYNSDLNLNLVSADNTIAVGLSNGCLFGYVKGHISDSNVKTLENKILSIRKRNYEHIIVLVLCNTTFNSRLSNLIHSIRDQATKTELIVFVTQVVERQIANMLINDNIIYHSISATTVAAGINQALEVIKASYSSNLISCTIATPISIFLPNFTTVISRHPVFDILCSEEVFAEVGPKKFIVTLRPNYSGIWNSLTMSKEYLASIDYNINLIETFPNSGVRYDYHLDSVNPKRIQNTFAYLCPSESDFFNNVTKKKSILELIDSFPIACHVDPIVRVRQKPINNIKRENCLISAMSTTFDIILVQTEINPIRTNKLSRSLNNFLDLCKSDGCNIKFVEEPERPTITALTKDGALYSKHKPQLVSNYIHFRNAITEFCTSDNKTCLLINGKMQSDIIITPKIIVDRAFSVDRWELLVIDTNNTQTTSECINPNMIAFTKSTAHQLLSNNTVMNISNIITILSKSVRTYLIGEKILKELSSCQLVVNSKFITHQPYIMSGNRPALIVNKSQSAINTRHSIMRNNNNNSLSGTNKILIFTIIEDVREGDQLNRLIQDFITNIQRQSYQKIVVYIFNFTSFSPDKRDFDKFKIVNLSSNRSINQIIKYVLDQESAEYLFYTDPVTIYHAKLLDELIFYLADGNISFAISSLTTEIILSNYYTNYTAQIVALYRTSYLINNLLEGIKFSSKVEIGDLLVRHYNLCIDDNEINDLCRRTIPPESSYFKINTSVLPHIKKSSWMGVIINFLKQNPIFFLTKNNTMMIQTRIESLAEAYGEYVPIILVCNFPDLCYASANKRFMTIDKSIFDKIVFSATISRYLEKSILFYDNEEFTPYVKVMQPTYTIFDMNQHNGSQYSAELSYALRDATIVTYSCIGYQTELIAQNLKKPIYYFSNATCIVELPKMDKPKRLIDIKMPIIGYCGSNGRDIDYSLLLSIAIEIPTVHIVIIGPDLHRASEKFMFNKVRNVTWLDEIPYSKIQNYIQWFDISILPYKPNTNINPLKLYDYLLAGKPIIYSGITIYNKPLARVCHKLTKKNFVDVISTLLMEDNVPTRVSIDVPIEKYSWKRVIEGMIYITQKVNLDYTFILRCRQYELFYREIAVILSSIPKFRVILIIEGQYEESYNKNLFILNQITYENNIHNYTSGIQILFDDLIDTVRFSQSLGVNLESNNICYDTPSIEKYPIDTPIVSNLGVFGLNRLLSDNPIVITTSPTTTSPTTPYPILDCYLDDFIFIRLQSDIVGTTTPYVLPNSTYVIEAHVDLIPEYQKACEYIYDENEIDKYDFGKIIDLSGRHIIYSYFAQKLVDVLLKKLN